MLLERTATFNFRDESGEEGDGLTLSGYAAVFNTTTEIRSWEGNFLEQIAPGAFRKTLRERTPVLQFDHGHHPLIGSIPIGTISDAREDDEGLAVVARLTDNWLMEPVRDAIRAKAVNGMSFRFEVVRDEWKDVNGQTIKSGSDELWSLLWESGDRGPITRTLKEVKVAELGPVVFPAYRQTSVDVRARGMAEMVMQQDMFVLEMRKAIAASKRMSLEDFESLQDTKLRKDLARAILFRDAPVKHHPSEEEEHTIAAPVEDEDHSVTERNDAPIDSDHPSPASDNFKTRLIYGLRAMDRRLDDAMDW